MTVDERLQFLLQSTESLHSSTQDLSATVHLLSSKVGALTDSIAGLNRVVEIDADNIRRLANIAAAHDDGMEDLRTRLARLEARGRQNH
jgi:hypothetical protein